MNSYTFMGLDNVEEGEEVSSRRKSFIKRATAYTKIRRQANRLTRNNITRDRSIAHERLVVAFFTEDPIYDATRFRKTFRMARPLFNRIVNKSLLPLDQKFRQGCKKARKMNGNPSGSDEIPSKNLTGWLQDAAVGESIVIHTTSELQSILRQPFNVSDCKVNHLGGSRILLEFRNEKEGHHSSTNCLESEMSAEVGEKLKHAFDLGSDRIDPIVEGEFNSNCGELKQQLNPNVEEVFTKDVMQQQDPGDDDKDVKPSDPEINGKGDEIISGSPITTGLVGVLLSHNGDVDNNHGDDGFGDVEGTVTEKAPHDVDTSVTLNQRLLSLWCQIVKRFGTLFLRR
ncbi:hypothetical protein Tco_1181991 [Tanacetum coccineum]